MGAPSVGQFTPVVGSQLGELYGRKPTKVTSGFPGPTLGTDPYGSVTEKPSGMVPAGKVKGLSA